MSGTDFDPDAHIDAVAATTGLTVTAEQRPGVRQFLVLAHRMNAVLEAAPVPPDTLELAPVFCPPERES